MGLAPRRLLRPQGGLTMAEPEPAQWALVQWDDGTVSLTDVSLLARADDDAEDVGHG